MLEGATRSTFLRMGLLLVALGFALDVVAHTTEAGRLGWSYGVGHLVTLAGMVVTMLGVFSAGLRCRPVMRAKGEHDAARGSPSTT